MTQQNPTPADVTDRAILGLLSDSDAQRPWSVDEIAREMGDRRDTIDGLARLYGAGLIHRCGDFAWPTRAALAADALAL
jgi:hypothetical protein